GSIGGALGTSNSQTSQYSYAQIYHAFQAHQDSPDARAAFASLTASDPISGVHDYFVTSAEAKALGLIDPNGSSSDGLVTLSNQFAWDYNNSGGVSPGTF